MVEATEGSKPRTEKETEKDSKKVKSLLSQGQSLLLYLGCGVKTDNHWYGRVEADGSVLYSLESDGLHHTVSHSPLELLLVTQRAQSLIIYCRIAAYIWNPGSLS